MLWLGVTGDMCVSWAVSQGAHGKCSVLLGREQGCSTGLVTGGQRFPSPSQADPGECYPIWGNGSLADLTAKIQGLWEGYNNKSDLWRTILT